MEIPKKLMIEVDLNKNVYQPVAKMVQHDTNIIEFVVKENGVDADLSNVGKIEVKYRRPDKEVIDKTLTAVGNKITYQLGYHEMLEAGEGKVELQFYSLDNLSRITTKKFKFYLSGTLGNDVTLEKQEDYTSLQTLFIEVDQIRQDTDLSKQFAQEQGNYAKEQGDIAKTESSNLSTLKQNVETATANANTATTNANTAADNANTKAQFAQEQGDYAQEQAERAKAETDRLVGVDVAVLENRMTAAESGLAEKAKQSDLNTTNTNLALKADTTYVDTKVAGIDKGFGGTYANLATIQSAFPTGDTKRYVTSDNGHWYYWNGSAWIDGGVFQGVGIGDNSVKLKHTSFKPITNGVPSKNLFDKDSINTETYLNNLGVEFASAGYFTSGFIPISPNTSYYINSANGNRKIAFYDSSKVFISYVGGTTMTNPFTTPANAVYLKVANANAELNTLQIELGTAFTGYQSFGYFVEESNLGTNLKATINDLKTNKNGYLVAHVSKNLFDKDNVKDNVYVRYNDGTEGSNSSYVASDFIIIEPNVDYVINHFDQVAFFYENKTYVSGVNGYQLGSTTFKTPANAYYIRVSVHKPHLNEYQLEKGTVSTEYESFGIKVKEEQLPDSIRNITTFKRVHDVIKPLTDTTKQTKIKLIGDSITAGVGGTGYATDGAIIYGTFRENLNGHCWANSLRDYFQEKFNCVVKNWGISGRLSYDLLNNISTLVEADDDIVICMIGTNDRNTAGNVSVTQLANNLKSIADYVTGQGKEIIFMSNVPASITNETDTVTPKSYHMEDVDFAVFKATSELNREYISLYKEMVNYCDYKDITIDSLLKDGLHPNDTGYDVMFKMVSNKLGIGTKRHNATW